MNLIFPNVDHRTSSFRLVADPPDLHSIRDVRLNLCVLRRTVAPVVLQFVEGVLLDRELTRTVSCVPTDPELGGLLHEFPASEGRTAFAADLFYQLRLFAEFSAAARYQVKLIATGTNQCERFHVDCVPLRSLCTYAGPTTEWLDNADMNRAKLGLGSGGVRDEDSGLLRPGARIQQLPLFSVAWMKGTEWPGNDDGGMVHRSPHVLGSGRRRVLFKIDADTKKRLTVGTTAAGITCG